MAAELQPPDPQAPLTSPTINTPTPPPPAPPISASISATASAAAAIPHARPDNPAPSLAPKRQRRPSVRLGEIGEQSYDSHPRRTKQQHPSARLPKDSSSTKSVKARSLTNLVNGDPIHENEQDNNINNNNSLNGTTKENNSNLDFVHRKAKAKRGTTKRVRSSWVSRPDDVAENSREDGDEGFRDFDPDSDSPLKDNSPVHSVDNLVLDLWHRRAGPGPGRARIRENDAMEMDNMPESDNDRRCGSSEGVRSWLIELGLSRYAPLFEIHEVDDEVLPLLTLEDLKDMGINAVGSRRKLYAAIQKLRKGFS